MSADDLTEVIQTEIIAVTGEGYDVMLDIVFPKGLFHFLFFLLLNLV